MPDTKISAMNPTVPLGPELVPIVQGGLNFRCTAAQIAALGGGGGGGPIWITPAGMVLRWQNVANTAFWELSDSGHSNFTLQNGLSWVFNGVAGNLWQFNQAGLVMDFVVFQGALNFGNQFAGQIQFAMPANSMVIGGFAALNYQYIAGAPANWVGVPVELQAAIDRLAAAIVARTIGGAIP
jgi:hypothetical protein